MRINKEKKEIVLYRHDLSECFKDKDFNSIVAYDFKIGVCNIDKANLINFIDTNGNIKCLKDKFTSIKGGVDFFNMKDLNIIVGIPNNK